MNELLSWCLLQSTRSTFGQQSEKQKLSFHYILSASHFCLFQQMCPVLLCDINLKEHFAQTLACVSETRCWLYSVCPSSIPEHVTFGVCHGAKGGGCTSSGQKSV